MKKGTVISHTGAILILCEDLEAECDHYDLDLVSLKFILYYRGTFLLAKAHGSGDISIVVGNVHIWMIMTTCIFPLRADLEIRYTNPYIEASLLGPYSP